MYTHNLRLKARPSHWAVLLLNLLFFDLPGIAQKVKKHLVDYVGPLIGTEGAGNVTIGPSYPLQHGIELSTKRLNKIIQIDERNLQATMEPSVINEACQNAVKQVGLSTRPGQQAQLLARRQPGPQKRRPESRAIRHA